MIELDNCPCSGANLPRFVQPVILAVLSSAFIDMYRVRAAMESGTPVTNLAKSFPALSRTSVVIDGFIRSPVRSSVTLKANS